MLKRKEGKLNKGKCQMCIFPTRCHSNWKNYVYGFVIIMMMMCCVRAKIKANTKG